MLNFLAETASKWMKRFDTVGKWMGVFNIGMAFTSAAFSIVNVIRLMNVQEELMKKQKK